MPRYVAFLRAINVGGRVVKMERLRAIFEALAFGEVETFIASGNVIFTSRSTRTATLEREIETALQQELGYEVKTFIRSIAEVAQLAANQQPASGTLFVGFLQQEPDPTAAAKLLACSTAVDDFKVVGRELFWHCDVRASESEFSGGKIEKLLALATTLRNLNTLQRLAQKYAK